MCFDLALLASTSLSVERDSVEVLELGRVLLDVNWSLRLNPNRGYLERFDEIKTHKKYDCLVLYVQYNWKICNKLTNVKSS